MAKENVRASQPATRECGCRFCSALTRTLCHRRLTGDGTGCSPPRASSSHNTAACCVTGRAPRFTEGDRIAVSCPTWVSCTVPCSLFLHPLAIPIRPVLALALSQKGQCLGLDDCSHSERLPTQTPAGFLSCKHERASLNCSLELPRYPLARPLSTAHGFPSAN